MYTLHTLTKITDKKKKRVGRGYGSGKGGHTSGRGNNGQNSRAGGKMRPTFAGGQNELIHQLPVLRGRKRARAPRDIVLLNLTHLNVFKDGEVISYDALVKKNLIKDGQSVKILNKGKLQKNVSVEGIAMSRTVQEQLTKAVNKE